VIWILLALMLATMLLGMPILLAIALVGYVGIAAVPGLVLPLFAQKMFAQLDSFTLLALPYFILAGALMSASGMSQQLVDFSRVLVGHLRAGLAHASIVTAMILSGVSGSSTVDATAIAQVLIPTMKKSSWHCVTDYPPENPFCPFCEGRDFDWEDGGTGVYDASGVCRVCRASVDIRGIERLA